MLLVAWVDVFCDSLRMLHKQILSILFRLSTLKYVGARGLIGFVAHLYALLLSQLSCHLLGSTGTHWELIIERCPVQRTLNRHVAILFRSQRTRLSRNLFSMLGIPLRVFYVKRSNVTPLIFDGRHHLIHSKTWIRVRHKELISKLLSVCRSKGLESDLAMMVRFEIFEILLSEICNTLSSNFFPNLPLTCYDLLIGKFLRCGLSLLLNCL